VTRNVEQPDSRPAPPTRHADLACCSTATVLSPTLASWRWAIERMREFLGQLQSLVADGSEHEVEAARRGALDELALEITWAEEHALAIVGS
jgi:hypothetical protein